MGLTIARSGMRVPFAGSSSNLPEDGEVDLFVLGIPCSFNSRWGKKV
jgi:hypothetical protein